MAYSEERTPGRRDTLVYWTSFLVYDVKLMKNHMGHLWCRTKQVLFENEFHMMCCLANSPAISRSAVILILAYNEMVFHRMKRGGLQLHTVRPNAKCGASLKNEMFLSRSATLGLAQTTENLPRQWSSKASIYPCGFTNSGTDGIAERGGWRVETVKRGRSLHSSVLSGEDPYGDRRVLV